MVQAASFAVLAAVAFGAVSVAAVPVKPAGSAPGVQRPMQPAARPFGPGPQRLDTTRPAAGAQRLENPTRPAAGSQRPENPARPGAAGQRLEHRPQQAGSTQANELKSQNQAVHKMEEQYASADRKKAQGFETKFKADEAEYKSYEAEASRLDPTTGRPAPKKSQQKVRRAPPTKGATPAPARPAANNNVAAAARPNTPSRPTTPGSTGPRPAGNGRPSTQQQQLSTQRTALQNEKQKFATEDTAQAKKYQSEADAYRAEAQRLEPSQRKPAAQAAKPQTYQQDIAAQNAGLKNLETKFATQDRAEVAKFRTESNAFANQANQFAPATGPRDLEDEAEFFARLDWEEAEAREFEDDMEEFAREWDEYEARAGAEGAATEEAAPAPAPHHRKKGRKHSMSASNAGRDFEDDVEEFIREWDEYEIRADPSAATEVTDSGASAAAPPMTEEPMAMPAPVTPTGEKKPHHRGNGGKRKGSKGPHKKVPTKAHSLPRDFEDAIEEFAREWAALEELD